MNCFLAGKQLWLNTLKLSSRLIGKIDLTETSGAVKETTEMYNFLSTSTTYFLHEGWITCFEVVNTSKMHQGMFCLYTQIRCNVIKMKT
jgi:hypothetical protein